MNVAEVFERQAMQSPDRLAVRWRGQEASYRDFLKMVLLLAGRLQEAGIGPGHRIGNTVSNPVSNMALTLAIAHLGAVSVSLPTPVSAESLEATGRASGMTHLVHARETPFDNSVVPPARQFSFAALSAKPEAGLRVPPLAQMEAHDLWRITLSSGTTGAPKAIGWTHERLLGHWRLQQGVRAFGPGVRFLPFMGFDAFYPGAACLFVLFGGGAVVVTPDVSLHSLEHAVDRFGVTHVLSSSALIFRFLESLSSTGPRFPGLAALRLAGSPLSPQMVRTLMRRVTPNIVNDYGSTEVGLTASGDRDFLLRRPGAVGRLMPWVEAHFLESVHLFPLSG